jgi:hypothetical protein
VAASIAVPDLRPLNPLLLSAFTEHPTPAAKSAAADAHSHAEEIGNYKRADLLQIVHVPSYTAGCVGNVSTPESLVSLLAVLCALFKPDLDHK